MRLKCLGCEALAREIYFCAATSPHIVDVELFEQGLHDTPVDLNALLQRHIDGPMTQGYDAIVLVYGLCGRATAGLKAKGIPLVVPRAHDCIRLLLGSRGRYLSEFNKNPGTYWFANDYVERGKRTGSALTLGWTEAKKDEQAVYAEYVAKFGEDNADYLMEVMGTWSKHYSRAVFVDMGVGDASLAESRACELADKYGWTFERALGDMVLVRRLVGGDWDNDFLVLQPGEEIAISSDERVMCEARSGQ